MAIDSQQKRRSASPGIPGVPGMPPGVQPDGTIDESDRAEHAGFYGGLSYAVSRSAGSVVAFVLKGRDRAFTLKGRDRAFTLKGRDRAFTLKVAG